MRREGPFGLESSIMCADELPTVKRIVRHVEDGLLPPISCANCTTSDSEVRTLYAICARADVRKESRGGSFIGGFLGGIPFLFPTGGWETTEIREGQDIVVPVPLRVCDECWEQLNGGFAARLLGFISGATLLAGLIMIILWAVSKARHAEFSFLYVVACFAGFLPFYAASEWLQAKWPRRLRNYLVKVPEYATLLSEYPDTEIVTEQPVALDPGDNVAQL